MKKTVFNLALVAFLTVLPASVTASEKNPVIIEKPVSEIPAEAKIMLNRLEEIKGMDKSNLDASERKELRGEVREIRKELRGKGIYISTGAIIIILLLILIL